MSGFHTVRSNLAGLYCLSKTVSWMLSSGRSRCGFFSLASISTPNNLVNAIGVFEDEATTQANWMMSFLPPNQDIDVG